MTFSLRAFITLLTFAAVTLPLAASADNAVMAPNARITGSTLRLHQLAKQIGNAPCGGSRCLFRIPTTVLNVSVPGEGRWRLELDRAKFSRNVERVVDGKVLRDIDTRPVHFRGKATATGRSGATSRVVVTVFRDVGDQRIEVALERGSLRRSDKLGSIVVRLPHAIQSARRLNARAAWAPITFLATRSCGTDAFHGIDASHIEATKADSFRTERDVSIESFSVVRLATDYDPQFAAGCSSCNNQIETYVERASNIYESQFTITFSITHQYGPNSSIGNSTDSGVALDTFLDFNNFNRSGAKTDIFTLFTGRQMQDQVIGLAYVGVACRYREYSDLLVQRVSNATNHVILAHELGHTFNANHTASGIMTTALDPSNLPTSFNATSASQISSYLSSHYPGLCTGGVSSGQPTPTPTAAPTKTPSITPTPGGTPGQPQPTATPTPTRTPRSGGGNGGGGSSPGDTIPETLSLQAKVEVGGFVNVTSTVSSVQPGCVVQLRAGGTKSKSVYGRLVAQFEPITASSTLVAQVPFKVKRPKQRGRGGANIFLMGRYYCPSTDKIVEQSKIVRFTPNRAVIGRRTKVLGKSAYIRRLVESLLSYQ